MTLFFYDSSSGYEEFLSLENLVKIKEITEIDDELLLKDELSKGNNIYCCIDPYDNELYQENRLMWDKDKESLENRNALNSDEI